MSGDQYGRICSAIEYTLGRLHEGPKKREQDESERQYERRYEVWYNSKMKFVVFAIRCLRQVDAARAEIYMDAFRQLGDDI